MSKLNGFYPRRPKVFYVVREKGGTYSIRWHGNKLHRSGISTRKDAENQCVSLNFQFEKEMIK